MKKVLTLLLALCLVAGLLPFAAFAAPANYISIRVENGGAYAWYGETDKYMAAGDATRYLVTSAEGAISVGTEDNWNLKLEYPADGTATLTLKGATIVGGSGRFPLSVMGNVDCTVVVETDSTVSTVNRTGLYISNSANTTITGPGKLSISSTDGICISAGGGTTGTLTLKNADIQINVHGESTNRAGISVIGAGMTIDNSKVNIVGTGKNLGIWGHAKVTLKEDGTIDKLENTWSTDEKDIKRNIVIQNGSVVTGNATAREFLGASGDVIIKDSTVEASISHSRGIFQKKPVLEGEYTAVAGAKAAGPLNVYNPSKFTSYKYFKVVPGVVDLGSLGVVTTPPTEETTPPTEETTPPTEEIETPTTEPTEAPTQAPTNAPDSTEPGATQAPTNAPAGSNDSQQAAEGEGMDSAMLALIIVGSVAALAGIALVLLWFVIKPKWLVK